MVCAYIRVVKQNIEGLKQFSHSFIFNHAERCYALNRETSKHKAIYLAGRHIAMQRLRCITLDEALVVIHAGVSNGGGGAALGR